MLDSVKINKKYKLEKKKEKEIIDRQKKIDERFDIQKKKFFDMIEEKKKKEKLKLNKKVDIKYEKKVREIEWKKPLKKHEKKPKTTAKLKKELYTAVQLFARLRDSNHVWYGNCISCWGVRHYTKAVGWHYIPRWYMFTAFDERNISLQCHNCNWPLKWNYAMYRDSLLEKYWEDVVKELEASKNKIRDWKRSDILDKIEYYEKVNAELEKRFL